MKSSTFTTSATSPLLREVASPATASAAATATPPTTTTTGERLFGTYSPPVVPPFRQHDGTYATFAAIAPGTGAGALMTTTTPIIKGWGTAGTTAIPFRTTLYEDGSGTMIRDLQAITAMQPYENSSFEELRLEDYAAVSAGNNSGISIACGSDSGSGRVDSKSSSSVSNAATTTTTGAISEVDIGLQNIDLSSVRASPSTLSQASVAAAPIVGFGGLGTNKYLSPSNGFYFGAPSSSAPLSLTPGNTSTSLNSSSSGQVTTPYKFGTTTTDLSSGGVLGSLPGPVAQRSSTSPSPVRASRGAKKKSASRGTVNNDDAPGKAVSKVATTPRRRRQRSKAPTTTPRRKCVTWTDQFTPNRKPRGLFRLTPEEKAELRAIRPDLNRPPRLGISSESVNEGDEEKQDTCDDIFINTGVSAASDRTLTPTPSPPSKGKLFSPNRVVDNDSKVSSSSSKVSHEHIPSVKKSGKSTSRRSKSCQKQQRNKQLVDCTSRASSSSRKAPKENNSPNIKGSSRKSTPASKTKSKARKQQPRVGSSTPPRRRSERIAARLRSENEVGRCVDLTEA